ncbi:ROK family transcriptional regulator [Bifidobacterium scardovii]|uniref:ROK family transcriptional regulator n=1 Tax=Bifidobacterium scardovii TaxID=158787 RepID=A0A087DG46_9BIFI|nr:ROK family transcriptional regulator [Bifidobacterium scardovii]KFI94496.1 ROK family transcriptional regulator [Bifidobacterium scardovii]MDK6349289.1 ROK family transcriptional regulator [Bifidobacterium scardovii]MDU2420883.1 ROK family transcriptional regulator [Bifidobacterium scardovii]MDU8980626.1 ROK family transcriptional regulator [Bifidobacterium scardovii]BAQ31879.1 putative transcriptional repressor [Bifidobacterium scardovii JCM 12489 = DSM 13734]
MSNPNNAATSIASVSETNRSRIMNHLYRNGVSSRAQIAKALGLTPAAITKITARLIDAGVVKETGDMEGIKNRRSIGLALDSDAFHVIGVKFARSLVQIGVFDLSGKPLAFREMPKVTEDTIDATIESIRRTISDLLAEDEAIVAVGMAVPGPYLKDLGRTAVVSSMQGWRRVNFPEEFGSAFRVPVFVEQDARAGALAQYLFDPGNASDNLAYYLIGEGIGLGIIEQGRIIDGSRGVATEIGHVSIDLDGRPCDCGNVGCLERYCAAPAIHEMVVGAGDLIENASSLTHAQACRALFAKANGGDERARGIVRAAARYLAFGCVTIINMFNPERIIIGDIGADAGPLLLDEIQRVVDRHVIPELNEATTISLSELPSDAALGGAAAVAIVQFLEHPSMFFDLG